MCFLEAACFWRNAKTNEPLTGNVFFHNWKGSIICSDLYSKSIELLCVEAFGISTEWASTQAGAYMYKCICEVIVIQKITMAKKGDCQRYVTGINPHSSPKERIGGFEKWLLSANINAGMIFIPKTNSSENQQENLHECVIIVFFSAWVVIRTLFSIASYVSFRRSLFLHLPISVGILIFFWLSSYCVGFTLRGSETSIRFKVGWRSISSVNYRDWYC